MRDMVFQWQSEPFGAFPYVIAVYALGEAVVFHFLQNGFHFDFGQGFVGTGVGYRDDESGELIAGEQRLIQRGDAGKFVQKVVRMRADGVDQFLRPSQGPQLGDSYVGVFGKAGVLLVIEIMEQAGISPQFLVFAP